MNMKCDIYVQQNKQTISGNVSREWVYSKTINCKIEPLKTGNAMGRGDNKVFEHGDDNSYYEKFQLKMKSPISITRRARISSIRDNAGNGVYKEMDRLNQPDMIFDVTASHAEIDPLGKISYYAVTLQRIDVQHNDSTSN